MRSDTELHELARESPETLLLLLSGRRPACSYEAMSLALKQSERRVDEVLRPRGARQPWWVVEWQFCRDPDAERRLLEEGVMLAAQEGLWGRLRLGIVYATRAVARATLPAVLDPDGAALAFHPVRWSWETSGPRSCSPSGLSYYLSCPWPASEGRIWTARCPAGGAG